MENHHLCNDNGELETIRPQFMCVAICGLKKSWEEFAELIISPVIYTMAPFWDKINKS